MHDFIGTIFYIFQQAIPFALIGLVAGIAILVLLNRKGRQNGAHFPKGQAMAFLLLMCYFGGLAAITFLGRMGDGMRMGVQLRPFLAFWEAWNGFSLQVWLNPLLNIAMFLPLGILLPLAVKLFRRWYWMLAAGTGISFVVEVLQYIFCRGQADIDDLLCNSLGAMLGYCISLLFLSLARKRWKIAATYAALPVLSAVMLAGVFLAYHLQPYGNLEDAPKYAADTRGVVWVQECVLSDDPGLSGVYWAEPFTTESCDVFAAEFIERQGGEIAFGTPDVDVNYYNNSAFYSDHCTYSLVLYYNDRSYEYIDYRVDSNLRFSGRGGAITETELRAALEKLGIDVPDMAQFMVEDAEKGEYVFQADCVAEGDILTDGKLVCWVAESGVLYEVYNALSVSTLHGDAAIISSQEAYDQLCAGMFSWGEVPMFNYMHPEQVRVTDCALEYLTDSKGFRQPVYRFTLSNDGELQNWDTFVPALARS